MDRQQLREKTRNYLEQHREALLEDWFELIRHPSVSATGEGVEACCSWIENKMKDIGLEVTRHPVRPYPVL